MKYAHINENNQLLGWYDKEAHGTYIKPIYETKTTTTDGVETVENVLVKDGYYDISKIPTPNIEVSEEAWQNAVNHGHNKVNNDGTTELFDFRTQEEIDRQELHKKIQEALTFLAKTDNREFPSYVPKDGENIAETIAKRVEARQFIRENR